MGHMILLRIWRSRERDDGDWESCFPTSPRRDLGHPTLLHLEDRAELLLRRYQLVGYREEGQFEAGGDAGFVENVRQVALHGFLAERELLGDVAVAAAFDDAAHHVEFARGETVGLALGRLGLAHQIMQGRNKIHYTLAANPIVTGIDGADGGVEGSCAGLRRGRLSTRCRGLRCGAPR